MTSSSAAKNINPRSRWRSTSKNGEALRQDSERKLGLIQRSVNKRFIGTFQEFAAIEGSGVFDGFKNGTTLYLRYALRK
jgi:hypothetical protein